MHPDGLARLAAPRAYRQIAARAALSLFVSLGLAGCGKPGPHTNESHASAKPLVFASLLPQQYFVERIAGDAVTVDVLVLPGQSEHNYEPTPQQIARLAEARLLFCTGLSFEARLVERIVAMNPRLRVVDLRDCVPLLQSACNHEHEADGHDHAHGEPDPHIWMDPQRVKLQAARIVEELKALAPHAAPEIARQLATFEAELDALHGRIAAQLAPYRGRAFYVFHPTFGYFADAYGLVQKPVEVDGKEPSAQELTGLIDAARRDGARTILVQPQFPSRAAELLAGEIGARPVQVDPLAKDYFVMMDSVSRAIEQGMAGK
jgi:zinc transport system substrate-binding protein